jgi:hypothetical protein
MIWPTLNSLGGGEKDYAKKTAEATKNTADMMKDWNQNGLKVKGSMASVAEGPE